MTSKERFLTALAGGKPDRLPVTTHWVTGFFLKEKMGGMPEQEFYDHFGLDPILYLAPHQPDPKRREYFDPDQGAVALGMSTGSDSAGQVIVFDTAGPALLTSYAIGGAGIDALAIGPVDNPQQPAGTLDLVSVNQSQLFVIGNYIAPVSTLVEWFPDRPGMATGLAIMGFGGGALIGAPLAEELMRHFTGPGGVGAWQALLVMAGIYVCFMAFAAWLVKVPPE